jgi:hypothetical protein
VEFVKCFVKKSLKLLVGAEGSWQEFETEAEDGGLYGGQGVGGQVEDFVILD